MQRLCGLTFLAIVVLATAAPWEFLDSKLDDMWKLYKKHHNKVYDMGSERKRRFIWERNFNFIHNHNLEADMGHRTFRLGINEHADMTDEEYRDYFLGYEQRNSTQRLGATFLAPSNVQLPDSVDWRDKGYVTEVKDQGQCGSCWAFSATGSLEGQYFRKKGKLVSMSEQNLVDCSKDEGNQGCNGGWMNYAFLYVKNNAGIDSEESYPYEMKDGPCRFKRADVVTRDKGFVDIIEMDEKDLQKAVGTVGPVSVAIDASQPTFRFYNTGVYVDENCSPVNLNHAVLAVGYGTENGQKYWLVKNSWGKTWGDKGYIKMAKDNKNMCGIATAASYPLV